MSTGGRWWCGLVLAGCASADAGDDRAVAASRTASQSTGGSATLGPPPAGAHDPPAGPRPAGPPRCEPGVPRAACAIAPVHACAADAADRIGEWRFALITAPFDPTPTLALAELRTAWRAGEVAATDDTAAALAPILGPRPDAARLADDARPAPTAARRAIVPADQLDPRWAVIPIDGQHPLARTSDGPLLVPLCGAPAPVRNIEPDRLTTLVMSGTTALTGRTAERIDTSGVADTVRFIAPFFTSAELVHVSNEVSFVRDCHPRLGQRELVFCARDSYVGILEALHARIIELTGSHLVDHGARSLERTIDVYARHGWTWYGGGRTQLDATTPKFVEDHGNRFAFVGCNAVNWWVGAISQGPGVAHCDWARMVWQIHALRAQGYLPIATVQHRELRTHAPPPDLVRDLRRLAEAGAVFVLGSQAHVAHPWDVHFGAYVHYGPGNILFAQYPDVQREASVDKAYVHAGRLLTVEHLFVRTEHGQPRLLDARERARFLGQLADAAAAIAPPRPDAPLRLAPPAIARPDSLVIRGHSQPLRVVVPTLPPGARAPLVFRAAEDLRATPPGTFAVARSSNARVASDAEIAAFLIAKYPVDPSRVALPADTVDRAVRPGGPARHGRSRHRHRRHP